MPSPCPPHASPLLLPGLSPAQPKDLTPGNILLKVDKGGWVGALPVLGCWLCGA